MTNNKTKSETAILLFVVAAFVFISGYLLYTLVSGKDPGDIKKLPGKSVNSVQTQDSNIQAAKYSPAINPSEFSPEIDNKYFRLVPGAKAIYEKKTSDGTEIIEVYVKNETKLVNGVATLVVWDRVWLNDDLIEDTLDWYAQDKDGNVWYFGEDTKELENGRITTTKGTWKYGVDGALPGIVMKANPKAGDSYYQEYYRGEAEDKADVVSIAEKVSVPSGSYSDCIKTFDYTPLDPSIKEFKYYCASTGGIVLEEEDGERLELVSISFNSKPSGTAPKQIIQAPAATLPKQAASSKISEDIARSIALEEVPGIVTDVATEILNGESVYVIEIDADDGPETDVFIDMYSGEILKIES